MPRPLFYTGVVFAFLIALLSVIECVDIAMDGNGSVPALAAAGTAIASSSPLHLVAALVMALPVAAIFLRLATLVAPRDLFGAFAAVFAIAGATVAVAAIALLRLRFSSSAGASREGPLAGDLDFIGWQILGLFLSLALLSTRAFFSIRSPLIGTVVCLPAALYFASLAQRVISGQPPRETAAAFFATTALSLGLIASYAVRHRHRLLETTSLDGLVAKLGRGAGGSDPIRIDGGIAFDRR